MNSARLESLDAFRGFTMFWLVGGRAFVAALAALGGPWTAFVTWHLSHSEWEGLRYYDVIWPSFMLMVGVSIPLAHAVRSGPEPMWRVWRRAAILFLLGSLRESMSLGVPAWIELSSALQPIAAAYLVSSYLARCSQRVIIAVAAAILIGYGLIVAPGSYSPASNSVITSDTALIGRAHKDGWGTALSTIPTISTTLLGLLLGQILASPRSTSEKIQWIAGAGAICTLSGLLASAMVPVIMKLWTVSYGLLSAACACWLFLLFYWLVDVRGWRRWSFPLVVIGMNALAAYLGPSVVSVRRITQIFTSGPARQMGDWGPVLTAGVVLLSHWLILWWMHRRRIFLRP